jgi:SpoU rRNA methylase family enzyme
MARFGDFDQYLDNAGDPLAEGKLYFYESGTTTPKTTYADINNSIPNTNPVLLSAAGRQPNIFFDGVAKVILTDNDDVQIAVRDPAGETGTDFGDEWVATKIYNAVDVVLGSDGIYYRSLINGNQNNNPVTTSGSWTLLYSVEWNAGITYSTGDVVTYGSQQYQSLQDSNLNQNPASATSYWVSLAFAWLSTATYSEDQNVVGTDGILYTSLQNSNTGNDPASSPAYWVGTSAAAAASAIAAAASAAAALVSENAAAADAIATAADRVQTGLDAAATAADAIATAADRVQTGLDAAATAADVILTNADAVATAADRVQTGLDAAATSADAIATAADRVQTGLDVIATNADASSTAADAIATAADRVQTGLDVVATSADVVQTGLDVTAAAGSASAASGSASAAAASAVSAAASYDAFDDRYLGEKASDPTLDNDGNALLTGALYFNTVSNAMKVYTGSAWSAVAPVATSVTLSQVTDFPSQSGETGKYLTTNGTVPSWATLVTDPTLGTLTKTFTSGESSTINLTSSVLAPVVSVTKEVPQSGVTNNNWDVNSTTENYTRLDSASATTLDFIGFGVSGASFVDSFSITAQDTTPADVAFNTDGTKMFVVGHDTAAVYEYTLSTAFDVSTATVVDGFSVSSQEATPAGLAFNTDGTKMFVVGYAGDDVNEYTLSTGFDVSTASFVDSFSVAGQDTAPVSLAFNTDGTKMFVVGATGQDVNEYTLSTGFDVSTASFVDSFSVTTQDTEPRGVAFNTDGTTMFIVGQTGDSVYEYALTTGFDVSTASFVASFSVSAQDTSPAGIAFSADGMKMFVTGQAGDDVNEYSTPPTSVTLGTGSFASADVGKTIEANSGAFVLTATSGSVVESTAPTSYDQVASGSWEMYGVVYNAVDGDLELSGVQIGQFDVSTAVYSQAFSVAAQNTLPLGLAFNTDGTKMFIVGNSGDTIYEYTLSTGFDVSTSTFVDGFSVGGQEQTPTGMAFNTDGTKMFIVGQSGDDVNEYTLSTGFDVSTATFVDSFSVSAQETNPTDIAFNTDGTKMFVVGSTGDDVNEYALSTGFDVSTASFTDSFSVASQDTEPTGIAFNTDGTKMFIVGTTGNDVNEYALTTGFDVSTASYTQLFSVAGQDTNPQGIAFNADGTKMFIAGDAGDSVYEYTLSTTYTPSGYQPVHTTASIDSTYWTDINSMTADQAAGDGNVYYAISTDDRTTWTVIDNTDGERDIVRNNAGTWQYNSNGTYASETWTNATTNTELATLAEAMEGAADISGQFDVSTSVYLQSFSIAGQETGPQGIAFNNNGTKMFVVGDIGDDVNEYALSTGFDVSTASFTDAFSIAGQETIPTDVAFNDDGTKMFVLGYIGKDVNEYSLSTGFDVSTASYSQNFYIGDKEDDPQGIAFNNNGTQLFVVGFTNKTIYKYALSTGFDVSTAVYSQLFSVASQEGFPRGIAFNTDGTKMFIVGSTDDEINEYSLSTAFDLSAVTFVDNFSVATQDALPMGMAFNTDGTKMFIVGATGDAVYEYSVGTTAYPNQMDKTQLDAVTDPNHIALGDDLDLSIIFNMTSGTTVPSSDGVAINYDANILNQGAVLGTDYDFDAPTTSSVRITALAANNLKVRVV